MANFSGADLAALVRQAAVSSLKKILLGDTAIERKDIKDITVGAEHFEMALKAVRPSVSDKDRQRYEQLRSVFGVPAM